MRLTLRTLLAYLDDVLDPADKEELGQKITSSEFAEDLVHRTRDTVRRLRLSAPQVVGTGMGLDPNTVAEYLDNVMPPEQVGDFERICLESDVHLAETAACHHVLTMVLGSPADVDPIARQRMYKIPNEIENRKQLRIEPAHKTPNTLVASAAAIPAQPLPAAAAPLAAVEQAQRVEVPDYLRAGSWWRSTNAVIGLAALVLIGTGVVLFTGLSGWFGTKTGSAPLIAESSVPAAPVESESPAALPSKEDSLPAPATAPPVDGQTADTSQATKSEAPLASPPPPLTPGLPQPTTPLPAPSASASAVTATPAPAATTDDRYPVPSSPAPVATEQPSAPADTTPPSPTTDVAAAPAPSVPPPTEPDGSSVPPTTEMPVPAAPPATSVAAANVTPPQGSPAALPTEPAAPAAIPGQPAAPPAAPPDSGTYMGGKTVLLRFDDQAGTWFRVEPRAPVVPGERLLSLPEFRPKVALTSGLQFDLSGGTQIVIGNAGDSQGEHATDAVVPTIELVYGRLVLVNPTNAERQVHLKLGPTSGAAKLVRNAVLGVEVERKFVPGSDPRSTPAPVETRLYAPDGGIVWQDAAGEKTVDKGAHWMLTEAGAGEIIADTTPPEWIDHEPVVQKSEQVYGAPVIESSLVTSAPVETQLLELFGRKDRKEVKSLATRSSIYVGLFQPFIDALRDSEQKASWKNHIDTLRAAMALSPESANKVYQALVDQRGKPAAADLYEMLCSYNAEQVGTTPEAMKTGALLKLIDWLEDDSLDYRVLAVQDLQDLTGKRLMPNPAAGLAERTRNVRSWRTRLEAGDLKPASAKAE